MLLLVLSPVWTMQLRTAVFGALCVFVLLCVLTISESDDDYGDSFDLNSTNLVIELPAATTLVGAPLTWTAFSNGSRVSTCSGSGCAAAAAPELDPIDSAYLWDTCKLRKGQPPAINGTDSCRVLQVTGADAQADVLLGGLDGLYHMVSCFDGKPLYRRKHGKGASVAPRVLWYSAYYGQWQFSESDNPSQELTVMYGDVGYVAPIEIDEWHLLASANSVEASYLAPDADVAVYFMPLGVRVACAPPPAES